jgi:large repetitive protein
VTATGLPSARVGLSYATQIRVTGGAAPYAWALTAGSLPAGMTWSASGQTAIVSGTPTKKGNYSFTLRVTGGSTVISRTFTLQVRG